MKNEKTILIFTFSFLFILSASLIYVMIRKDEKVLENKVKSMEIRMQEDIRTEENSWPKVEIEVRK